jgi:hypothetical protein
MNAELLLKRRVILAETIFAELILWRLPRIMPGNEHNYKYRLATNIDLLWYATPYVSCATTTKQARAITAMTVKPNIPTLSPV